MRDSTAMNGQTITECADRKVVSNLSDTTNSLHDLLLHASLFLVVTNKP